MDYCRRAARHSSIRFTSRPPAVGTFYSITLLQIEIYFEFISKTPLFPIFAYAWIVIVERNSSFRSEVSIRYTVSMTKKISSKLINCHARKSRFHIRPCQSSFARFRALFRGNVPDDRNYLYRASPPPRRVKSISKTPSIFIAAARKTRHFAHRAEDNEGIKNGGRKRSYGRVSRDERVREAVIRRVG